MHFIKELAVVFSTATIVSVGAVPLDTPSHETTQKANETSVPLFSLSGSSPTDTFNRLNTQQNHGYGPGCRGPNVPSWKTCVPPLCPFHGWPYGVPDVPQNDIWLQGDCARVKGCHKRRNEKACKRYCDILMPKLGMSEEAAYFAHKFFSAPEKHFEGWPEKFFEDETEEDDSHVEEGFASPEEYSEDETEGDDAAEGEDLNEA